MIQVYIVRAVQQYFVLMVRLKEYSHWAAEVLPAGEVQDPIDSALPRKHNQALGTKEAVPSCSWFVDVEGSWGNFHLIESLPYSSAVVAPSRVGLASVAAAAAVVGFASASASASIAFAFASSAASDLPFASGSDPPVH